MDDCLLLVGTRPERGHIVASARRAAQALGLRLVVIGDDSFRGHDDIVSVLTEHPPTLLPQPDLLARAEAVLQANNLRVRGVYATLDAWIECAAWMSDHFGVTANRLETVQQVLSKRRMRACLSAFEGLSVYSAVLPSPEDAERWMLEHPGCWVIKPTRGAGSRGITTDIKDPRQAIEAWHRCRNYLERSSSDFSAAPDAFSKAR